MRILPLALLALIAQPLPGAPDLPPVEVADVRKVYDEGHHNAFTDLCVFKGAFYLAFRSCPDGHGVSPNSSVIIMSSRDAIAWKTIYTFRVPRRDTRDPHFLVFKDRLFVYTGTWYSGDAPARSNADLELNQHLGYAVWSDDGASWSSPVLLDGTFGHYVWRAATHGGRAYLCARRKINFAVGPKGEPNEIESLMLESEDGLTWRKRSVFQEVAGDETAFLFERDGSILGIGRRRGSAQLLRAKPPYEKWQRLDLDRHIGGPLVAKWGGRTLVGGRRSTPAGPRTSLNWLVGDKLHEFAELPSGGDNSYPGFVAITPTEGLVSWYSSHEGRASIYLATLKVRNDLSGLAPAAMARVPRADTILSYQRANGGFPKGWNARESLTYPGRLKNLFARNNRDTTLDNGATHRQILELAEAYTLSHIPRFRDGCERGIEYLLEAQYPNGGFPQCYPERPGYARYITFNDDAMTGALSILHRVATGNAPFAWVNGTLRGRAADAVDRGVACILKCQVRVDGSLTAWAQQHDEITLEPRPARSFEPVSLCSNESVGVLAFLMSLESPGEEVIAAIEGATEWLKGPARLTAIDLDSTTRSRIFGKIDDTSTVWARLYEIGTNRPVFGDRDGNVYYDIRKISKERQEGYSWYGRRPQRLLEETHPAWRKRINR